MEQHNIDSRFKQGLENLNRQPSEDAWARLQARMNQPQEMQEPVTPPVEEKKEEKRILLWWHYAAAAVVLLFISFGIIKNGSQFGQKTQMQVAVNNASENKNPQATKVQQNASDKVESSTDKASGTQHMIAATTPETTASEIEDKTGNVMKNGSKTVAKTNTIKAPEIQIAKADRKVKSGKVTEMTAAPEKAELPEPAQVQEEKLLASATSKPAEQIETASGKPDAFAGMVIEVIVKKDNSDNAIAQAQPVTEDDTNLRLKGIVKQALNFKNGEPVSLQALGVAPDSKFAMGTKKLTKVLDI